MYQVVSGQMTIGSYTAFASYVSIYEVGFSAFADLWITLKQTIASTGRFLQVKSCAIILLAGSKPVFFVFSLVLRGVSAHFLPTALLKLLQRQLNTCSRKQYTFSSS